MWSVTYFSSFPQHGNGIMMLMAQAGLIKFCEMRNVFKCKYVRSVQKSESNAFSQRKRVREGANPKNLYY